MIAPSWMTTSNISKNASPCLSFRSSSIRIRCPVLLTGSHSVIPSTIPNMIAFKISNIPLFLL